MPAVGIAPNKSGDYFVDYEEKVFEDVKAEPGQKTLVTFHTVAFEGSIGLVNILTVTRLLRKGFETSILLYGPGVLLGIQRGFPKLGNEAFPGHMAYADRLTKFIAKGGKIYACRFALQALYGMGEPNLLPGITPLVMPRKTRKHHFTIIPYLRISRSLLKVITTRYDYPKSMLKSSL